MLFGSLEELTASSARLGTEIKNLEKEVAANEKRSRHRAAWRARIGGETIVRPVEFSHLRQLLGLP